MPFGFGQPMRGQCSNADFSNPFLGITSVSGTLELAEIARSAAITVENVNNTI